MINFIGSIKRNMYIASILQRGFSSFEGKSIYNMSDKELKLMLTLLKRGSAV